MRERERERRTRREQTDGLTETDRLYHTERQRDKEERDRQRQRNRRTGRLVSVSNTLSSRRSLQTHTYAEIGGGRVHPQRKITYILRLVVASRCVLEGVGHVEVAGALVDVQVVQ